MARRYIIEEGNRRRTRYQPTEEEFATIAAKAKEMLLSEDGFNGHSAAELRRSWWDMSRQAGLAVLFAEKMIYPGPGGPYLNKTEHYAALAELKRQLRRELAEEKRRKRETKNNLPVIRHSPG